jgi:hypothetical protein
MSIPLVKIVHCKHYFVNDYHHTLVLKTPKHTKFSKTDNNLSKLKRSCTLRKSLLSYNNHLSRALILVLLNSSGIERNPGPEVETSDPSLTVKFPSIVTLVKPTASILEDPETYYSDKLAD